MGFRNIWVKELRANGPLYGVYAIAVLLVHVLLLYKRESLHGDALFVLSLLLPFLSVSAMAVGTGYYQLHTEWRTNSIYLLLSLPIRGWKVLTAKLAAVITLLFFSLLWTAASFSAFLLRLILAETEGFEWSEFLSAVGEVAFHSFWMYFLTVLFVLALTQFTFLCGQLVAKFKWVVMICAFFGGLWLYFRISPVLTGLLQWMPDIRLNAGDADTAYLHSGSFLVLLAVCAGLTALNGYIFEKEVEV